MAWDERQAAMLAEMGIRLWSPAAPGEGGVDEGSATDVADAAGAASVASDAAGAADTAARRPPGAVPGGHAGELAPAPSSGDPDEGRIASVPAAGPERAAAIARLDWPALAEAVAHCRACALCRVRGRTVFGVGHPQAHCMVVGEAPGEQEDRQGEPFVGKAGQLLDAMLAAIGLARAGAPEAGDDPARRVYIANVLKCRPPHNRNPAPDEVALCEPFLRRQIALVRPRVILALGRYAVGSLLGSDAPIGRLRGRVHEVDGVPAVVSYHPAYLLRNPADKARAWEDLCLALELLRRGEPAAPSKRGSDRG